MSHTPDPWSPNFGPWTVGVQVSVPATSGAAAGASAEKRRDGGIVLVRLKVDVRDAGGALVRSLSVDGAVPAAHQGGGAIPVSLATAWDGISSSGPAAPSGTYSYDVRVTLLRRTTNPRAASGSAAAEGVETVLDEIVQPHGGTVVLDRDPPVCALAPASGTHLGLLTDTTFAVTWTDNLTGAVPSTFAAALNGVSIASLFTVTANGAHLSPTAAQLPVLLPLFVPGPNMLTVSIRDAVQNEGSSFASYVVDDLHDLDGSSSGPAPVLLSVVSGGGSALVGRPPSDPVMKVRAEREGQPAPGVPLEFVFTQGKGVVLDAPGFGMTTDANGLAAVRVILGHEEGTQIVEARLSGGAPGSGVAVSYSAHEPCLSALPVQLPEGFEALEDIPGSAWPALLEVEAAGLNGAPLAGAEVTYQIVDGTGHPIANPETVGEFLPAAPIADANGRARAAFVAAPSAPFGPVHVRAFLTEFPEVEAAFEGAIQDPASLTVHTSPFTGQPDEHVRLGISQGQAQIGRQSLLLSVPLQVQLYRDEAPTGPFQIDGTVTCPDSGLPQPVTIHFRTASFQIVAGEGYLSAGEGNFHETATGPLGPIAASVDLTPSGRASVRLTYGPKTEDHLVLSGIAAQFVNPCHFGGGGGGGFTPSAVHAAGVPELYLASVQDDGLRLRIPLALAAPQPSGGPAVLKHVVQARLPVGQSLSSVTLKVLDPLGSEITAESGYPEVTPEHALSMNGASNPTPERFALLESEPVAFDTDLVHVRSGNLTDTIDPLDPGIGAVPGIPPLPTLSPGPADARWVRGPAGGAIGLLAVIPGLGQIPPLSFPIVKHLAFCDTFTQISDPVWPELDWSEVLGAHAPWNVRVVLAVKNPANSARVFLRQALVDPSVPTSLPVGPIPSTSLDLVLAPNAKFSRQANLKEFRLSLAGTAAAQLGVVAPSIGRHTIGSLDIIDHATSPNSNDRDTERFRTEAIARFPSNLAGCGFASHTIVLRGDLFDVSLVNRTLVGGPPSGSFLVSAGAAATYLSFGFVETTPYWAHRPANWFYISGHGYHFSKSFVSLIYDQSVLTSDLVGSWTGVEMVLIAGCSLVDINDYNDKFNLLNRNGDDTNPGKDLAQSGAGLILGYNAGAPFDAHDADQEFTAKVVSRFFELRDRVIVGTPPPINIARGWLQANENVEDTAGAAGSTGPNPHTPMNAAAIDSTVTPRVYYYFLYRGNPPGARAALSGVLEPLW
ncbi:MAG: hypothetical protein HYY93_02015 [Planctomycetes bacterium]|nr:hypothetical protein [Planctomycetota bacterium]